MIPSPLENLGADTEIQPVALNGKGRSEEESLDNEAALQSA